MNLIFPSISHNLSETFLLTPLTHCECSSVTYYYLAGEGWPASAAQQQEGFLLQAGGISPENYVYDVDDVDIRQRYHKKKKLMMTSKKKQNRRGKHYNIHILTYMYSTSSTKPCSTFIIIIIIFHFTLLLIINVINNKKTFTKPNQKKSRNGNSSSVVDSHLLVISRLAGRQKNWAAGAVGVHSLYYITQFVGFLYQS